MFFFRLALLLLVPVSSFGPETVFNEAAYIDVNRGKLFYWVFESRNDPSTDPLIVWFSGGPGCSSMLALFSENGPYAIQDGEPVLNPYSWNANATAIWIDQPLGTGFSRGVPVHTEDQVAADMETFFEKFFEKYPKYATLPFYIFGESYAGHYVPAIASRLMGSTNLKGAAVGNGLTDPAIQYQWYVPFAEEHDLVSPATLKLMKGVEKLCEPLVKSCENDDADDDTKKIATWSECLNAYIVCNVGLVTPIQASGLNVYDVRLQCGDDPLCYDFSDVDDYLNRDDVKEALGVTKNWKECSKLVDLVMVYGGDWMKSYKANVKALLDNGISVLIYAGEYDFICNWMGNFAWTQALEWSGQDAFNNAPNSSFYLTSQVPCTAAAAEADAIMASPQVEKRRRSLFDCVLSTEAGSYVSAKNFTFLKVKDAGHLSPMDQPEATLEMVRRFTLNAGGWAG